MYRSLREGNGVGSVPQSGVTETRNGDVHCATSSASLSVSLKALRCSAVTFFRHCLCTVPGRKR